ncbi:MAG: ABC transporter permease, partial [Clostridioides sp.]|nr:ABC transporter permease [Clostridioides sp.]
MKKVTLKNIAKSFVSQDIIAERTISITIALSIAVVLVFTTIMVGKRQGLINKTKEFPQLICSNIDKLTLEKLKKSKGVSQVNERAIVGSFTESGDKIKISYYDKNEFDNLKITNGIKILKGEYPKESKGILLSEETLKKLNQNKGVGDKVNIDLTGLGKNDTYVISGIINGSNEENSDRIEKSYDIFVTKDTAINLLGNKPLLIDTMIKINDTSTNIENEIENISKKLKIDSSNISINSDYDSGEDLKGKINFLKTIIPIILVVILMSVAVIYNVFYANIKTKIKYYSKLRAIGIRAKQLKKIISYEGMYYFKNSAIVGNIIGLLL